MRKSGVTNQYAGLVYKYVFITRKNKAISARSVQKWKEKNDFDLPQNQFSLAGIRLFFKNWISTLRKKSPNKKKLFQ